MEETRKIPNHWKQNWYFSKLSTITGRTYMFNLKMLIPNGFFFKKTLPPSKSIFVIKLKFPLGIIYFHEA